ncbi:tRNA lysidine(34) synthetase TilS [Lactobacillus sp. LC28-10]|uniref:tRNA(Ile)-lysidine synthase n=1 Tax=Secundilactobacillus angelensis TaxID=2722706 RepID=A0ABX1KY94_9LACO|nr:tRNA lysidine(34) synthetase TilS [Secundilactobacillus angelensis]MCH5463094.1 tRNA lysidine(34) synthetase TilS [Secundilactobacillus angelensis]NLR18901.1 tRNA lysidine(34) synthetase TilS [Secundilactobacillus angelensis]
MNIAKQFKSRLASTGCFDAGKTVIVAVSTGVDSMLLLTLMEQLPDSVRPKLVVAHVNHQLRAQSRVEEQFIREYCSKHQIQLAVTRWSVEEHPQTGIEAAARQFRYDFFADVMRKYHAEILLTAHHADDQAETVLMKLVRGGQLSQLEGILPEQPFENGLLIRPLLPFSKQAIRAYAETSHLQWYEDETNQVDDIFRNRIRHQLMPALKQENPAFLKHVQNYSTQLIAALQLANERTVELLTQIRRDDESYSVSLWQGLTAVQKRAVLSMIFQDAELPVTDSYLDETSQLLNNQKKPTAELNLAASKHLEKAYDRFSIKSELKVPPFSQPADRIVVISNQWVQLSRGLQARLVPVKTVNKNAAGHMLLQLQPFEMPLRVRTAQPNDRIKLVGGGHKTIRRILIDHKIPVSKRQQQSVVVTANGEVLWLIGLQRSARDYTEPNYELVLKQSD